MSLRSLLPIGRSFSPHDPRLGRYRPADPGALPDFSDPSARPALAPTPTSGPSSTAPGPSPITMGAAATPAAVSAPTGSSIAPAAASPAAELQRLRRAARSTAPVGRRLPLWLENLLMALFGPGNRRRLSSSVQTEMDFRTVRVVRNDLTVSDLEAVPIRAPRAETSLSPDCRKRVLSLWFDQGSRRLRRWSSSLF